MNRFTLNLAIFTLIIKFSSCDRKYFDKVVKHQNKRRQENSAEWTAGIVTGINYDDDNSLKQKLGIDASLIEKNPQFNKNVPNTPPTTPSRLLQTSPATLDLRTKYPKCWSIGYIRDQAGCGSCWAVASASSLSDRYCIAKSTATVTVQKSFSYEDMIENCNTTLCGTNGNGCNGGYINGGYQFAKALGVVSGENYGNFTSCKPYFLKPGTGASSSPKPTTVCTNTTAYKTAYSKDKIKIKS